MAKKNYYRGRYKIPGKAMMYVKHYAMQYQGWRKALLDASEEKQKELKIKIGAIEQSATEAAPDFYEHMILAVTGEFTYDQLLIFYGIPCSRDVFYDRRRLFYWLLYKRVW